MRRTGGEDPGCLSTRGDADAAVPGGEPYRVHRVRVGAAGCVRGEAVAAAVRERAWRGSSGRGHPARGRRNRTATGMIDEPVDVPATVLAAQKCSVEVGFAMACENRTGALLRTVA